MLNRLTLLVPALLLAGCATLQTPEPADPAVAVLNAELPGAPYREGYFGTGEERIHYVEAGRGPAVVFVHGFPSFWFLWHAQLEAFRTCRRVIAIDAPGANLSAKPDNDAAYRIDRLAARLDAVLAELAPGERVTLVGHDWGGALAWSYAEWKSERLDRLAVFSAPPYDLFLELAADPAQQAASAYMQRLVTLDRAAIESGGVPQRLFESAYGGLVSSGALGQKERDLVRNALADPAAVNGGIAWYRANLAGPATRVPWPRPHAPVQVPTLLVEGSEDRTFIPAMRDKARDHASELRVAMLEGVGHWTPLEKPQAASEALGLFMGLPNGRCPRTGG